jgi:DNA-binding response OmpR family regulator
MSTEHSIMLVDDDTDLLFLLTKQFERAGFETTACLNGRNLINQLLEKKISVVLLDISMGSVSGKDLCKTIKSDKRTAGIKVLMMSADVDIKQVTSSCGADGFITKPIDMNKAKQAIRAIVAE